MAWSEVVPLALNGLGPYANEIGQNKRIEYRSAEVVLSVYNLYFKTSFMNLPGWEIDVSSPPVIRVTFQFNNSQKRAPFQYAKQNRDRTRKHQF